MTRISAFPSERSGVYRTPADVNQLKTQALDAGLTWSEVSLDASPGKRAALDAIAQAIGAPAPTFGGNWDALADVLQDLSWHPSAGQVLHLRGKWQASGDDHATLLEIARASADYWRAKGKLFFVFVDGAVELAPWT
jgi:hypothetical protein